MTRSGWRQVSLWCHDWQAAEVTGTVHVGPRLSAAEDAGSLAAWWFTRKGACWRLRLLPAAGQGRRAAALISSLSSELVKEGIRAVQAIYEPETCAFGGNEAMAVAHRLFHTDSRHVLAYLAQAGGGHRRELAVILATALMRAAGQDWYEQGDIWRRIAAHRSAPAQPRVPPLDAVRVLMTATGTSANSPLAAAPDWPAGYEQAGNALAALTQGGQLTRGLRAVLAHHVLFAWNRLGIQAADQQLLADSAATVIFDAEPACPRPRYRPVTTVNAVTTDSTRAATPGPAQLRDALADHIAGRGTFRTPQVEAAFRTVPRHVFLPGTDVQAAYAPQVVITKRGGDGAAISSASSPNLVAAMLEQLAVRPGDRILEIGTGTGFNAALLAELAGTSGHVTTIDIDTDITGAAGRSLAAAGYRHVRVVCADGADGYPAEGPYDRIIVTAGAQDLPTAWWQQLTAGGRIVVPLTLHGSGLTRSIAFARDPAGHLASDSALVCGFVPMRGSAAGTGRSLPLAGDITLHADASDDTGQTALDGVTGQPPLEIWTGITIGDSDPDAAHLDLWLATTATGSRFGRISAGPGHAAPLIAPARRWAGAALHNGTAIAYPTLRPETETTSELGIAAYGKDSEQLAAQTAALLRQWSQARPVQPVITAYPAGTPETQLAPGQRIDRLGTRLTVNWEQRERT